MYGNFSFRLGFATQVALGRNYLHEPISAFTFFFLALQKKEIASLETFSLRIPLGCNLVFIG